MFKKLLKILVPIVVASALGSLSFIFIKNNEYHVDTTFFQSTYAYKDDVNLEGLTIVETEKDEVVKEIPVDQSMVVSCDSTSSVGEKTLVLEYEKEQFIVNFVVMYEIQFIANEEVIDLQYVYKASEIKLPKEPTKTGYEFRGWSPAVPNVINDNMVFTATFGDVPVSIPNLGSYGTFVGSGSNGSYSRPIQYGDTLEGIELPSNEYGSWKFVDPLDTVVGNVGENKFMVEFIPTNPELTVLKDYVTVIVAKKTLEFKNIVNVFEYDGEVHVPTYELDVEGLTVVSIGDKNSVEVGDYSITYIINDANYEGMITIDYKIVSSEISISFDLTDLSVEKSSNDALYEIKLGQAVPEFNYSVTGIDDPSVLNIKLNVPTINHAGLQEITLTIGNASYTNVTITNKCYLDVKKIYLGVGKPEIMGAAIYGNKLSSVAFEYTNPNGYWAWENPDLVFDYVGDITCKMIFTPYSSLDYEVETVDIPLIIQKRELTFDIEDNEYIYEVDKDGNPVERTIEYKILDGENEITGINVEGNIVVTNASKTSVKLEIVEENYFGSISTELIIKKAVPETDFNVSFDAIIGTKLEDIPNMPEGYTWVKPTDILSVSGDGQTFDVIFTPNDTENYEIVRDFFTVNVKKKTASLVALDEYTFVYDGTVHQLYEVYHTDTGKDLLLLDANGQEVVLLNAGTYEVHITLPESDEYYEIVKVVSVTIDGSKAEKPLDYAAVYGDSLNSIELPVIYDENGELIGTWVWENDSESATVGEAGEQIHSAIFKPENPNYLEYSVDVKVTVAKKTVKIEIVNNTYDYEENVERTIEYKVLDGEIDLTDKIAITGNLVSVNVCKLSATLTVNEKNYQGSLETSLVINKIDPVIEWPTVTVPLNQELIGIELEKGFAFTCSNEILSNADTYIFDAEYTPVDPVNYNKLTGKITVVVEVSAATITGVDDSYRFEYGEEIVINATPSHNESELQFVYTLNGEAIAEPKNVGTYELTITLPATNNYVGVEKKVSVEIYEKELEVKWAYDENYVYTGSAFDLPSATVLNGTVELVVTETSAKDFVNASTYTFVAAFATDYVDASNYKLTNATSKEITVEKAVIDLSQVKWDYAGAFIYDENEHSVELLNLHSVLTVEYTENVKTDAGSYTATATVSFINPADADNYALLGEIADCEWIITSSSVAVLWTYKEEYTFTGEVLVLPKATILNGTIELTVTEVDGKVFRNADTYSFVASYEGANYEISNATLNDIVVEKAELQVNWTYNNAQTYDGSVLAHPTATVLNGEVELITKSLNTLGEEVEFKNAGTYTFVASFDAEYEEIDNYILDESTTTSNEVEILKADYSLAGMVWNYTSLTYNGAAQKVELAYVNPALTPIYTDNEFTNVGDYEASVTFKYDENNYNEPIIDSLAWSIDPYEATVSWTYEEIYNYTGEVLAAPTATYVNVNGETKSLAVVEANGKAFKEYGDYTFVASIANEEVANNYELIDDELELSIGKSKVTIGKLTATYGDTLADVELPESEFGTWVFVDDETTLVGNAGDNKFDITFNSTSDNYSTYTTTVTITVAKKLVVIDVIDNSYEYNSSAQSIDAKVKDGETVLDIVIYGNTPATNAGTYNVTLYINDTNYEAQVVSTVLEISKAQSIITNSLTETSRDYNGSETDIKPYFTLNHEEAELSFAITAARAITTIKDAGTYTIVVSVPETDNYLAEEIEVTYTVNKISPELTYNAPAGGYTYNGSAISVTDHITHVNTDQIIDITYAYEYEGEIVAAIKEAGTYSVTVSIAETTNFEAQDINFTVVVEKGHLDVGQMNTINAIYGQQLNHFEFGADARGTWAWKNPTDYVGNVGENKHIAILTPFDDSIDAEEVEITFNVSAKVITITLGQTTFDYDGNEHKVDYTLSETPEGVTVDVDGTIAATNYVEGGYAFTLTIAGNNNYVGTASGTLVINQISSGVTAPSLNATYKQTYKDIVLPTSEDGVWSLVVDNLSAEVGNAITKSVTVKYTPNDTNYKTETMSATLVVAKADYTPTTIPTTYDATYGDMLATLVLPTDDTNGSWRWEAAGSTVGNAGENTFRAIFTHSDQNYNVYIATVTVNVDKADSVITETLPSSFVYTGKELIKQYVKLNHSESSLVFTITGKDSTVVKAGTYNVVVTVAESENYYGTELEVGTIVVEQATPTTDFSTNFTYTYGKVLSSADLPDGYEWINEVKLEVGANQAIAAKYVPADTENFKTVYNTFNVTIERIVGTISVNDNQEFTYGDAIDLGASTNNDDAAAEIVIAGLTLNSDGFVDAGTYTVTLSVAETAHYTAVTETITVTVNKKEVEVETEESYEYGTEASDVQLTSVYGTFTTYSENPNASVQTLSLNYNSSNENGLFVQTKSIWVKFVPYAEYAHNFAEYIKEIVITIVKKELSFTNVTSSFVYDGNAHSVAYSLTGFAGSDTIADVTVNGNTSITNVVESTSVTLTVESPYYYGTWTGELNITKATPTTDFTKVYDVYWNTKLSGIDLDDNYSFDVDQTLSTVGDGQKFKATYDLNDSNYEVVKGEFTVNVKRIVTTISVNDLSGLTYKANTTYTITATATNAGEAKPVITVNGSETYSIGNAGTYNVVVSVEESAHYTAATLEYEIVIAKANPTTDFTTVYTAVWNTKLSAITLPTGYAWVNPDTVLSTVGNDQTFDATFTPSDTANYNTITKSFTVNVDKATATITANATYTFTYNGSVFTLTNVNPSHTESTVEYTYKIGETVYESLLNAGTYTVTITLPESAHYKEATTTATVTINKAKVALPTGLKATYGQTLANVVLPTSSYGTWSFVLDGNTSVGNVGDNTFQIRFTSTNANYTEFVDNVIVTVAQVTTIVTANIPTGLVYNGSIFNHVSWFAANHSETNINIALVLNGESVSEIKNAGTYTINVTMAELDNYTGFSNSYSVTISQAEYTVSGIPTASSVTYGDTISMSTLSGGDTNGTWTWVSGTDLVGNAGTRTHNAIFTPTDTNYKTDKSSYSINVTVNKKKLTFVESTIVSTFKYNGKTQYISYDLSGLASTDKVSDVTVTGNDGLIYVGSQVFTLTVVDSNYYSDSIEVTLTIEKGTPTVTVPTHENVYEDRLPENLLAGATHNVEGSFSFDSSKVTYPNDSTTSTATVKVPVTFTPNDTANYSNAIVEMSITFIAVAKNSNGIYFGTVEQALKNTSSGTISIEVGTNPIIKSNVEEEVTIKSGVTLFIPFSTDCVMLGAKGTAKIYGGGNTGSNAEITGELPNEKYEYYYGHDFATNYPNRLKNTLTIAENVEIINNGTIEISGQLSGGNGGSFAAGQTAGIYTRILLNANSKIVNNGIIYCYGYIDENTIQDNQGNGSEVEITSTGVLYQPFVLRDFRGGTVMSGLYYAIEDYHITAFNSFELRNVSSKVRVNYGGKVLAWANLFAGSQHNPTTLSIIGTQSSVINLSTEYSYLTSKYDPYTEITKLDIYGGAYTDSMTLKVKVALFSIDCSTADVYFPITWRYNITLNKASNQNGVAVYSMNQRFKMLPGAKLTVSKGAELTISEINIYESYTEQIQYNGSTMAYLYQDGSSYAKTPHNAATQPAKLIVNGEVTIGSVGGTVYTEADGARLIINNSTTLSTYEAINVAKGTLAGELKSTQTIGGKTKLKVYENGSTSADYIEVTTLGTYISKNGGWRTKLNINYNNVIISEESTYDEGTISFNNPLLIGNTEQITLINPVSTDTGFVFKGWYLEPECKTAITSINANDFIDDINLYAKWEYSTATKYNLRYEYHTGDGLISEDNLVEKNYQIIEGRYLAKDDLLILPEEKVGYKFNGWSYNGVIVTEDILIEGDITLVADYTRMSYNLDVTLGTAGISSIALTYTNSITNETQTLSASGTLTVFYYDTISINGTTTGNALAKLYINGNNILNAESSQFTFEKILDNYENSTLSCEAYVKLSANLSRANMTLEYSGGKITDTTSSQTVDVKCGSQFTVTFKTTASSNVEDISISGDVNSGSFTTPYTGTVGDANITMNIKYKSNGCFAEGTLITLSDGTTKKVEDLSFDDYVLGWDFEKGEYVSVPVLLPVYHGTYETNIVNLVFSDGSTIRMILEHGFFDMTLNQWVFITEDNYQDYLGHEFVSQDHTLSTYSNVKLIAAYVTTETVGVYGPVAAYTINCFAEGLLSMVPATGIKEDSLNGLFDYFEVGDNLQYDLELMNKDIETYGLYTYDDWKEYATEYEFEALNIKYLKVAVGKGLITEEDIKLAMQTYFPKA